MINLNANGQYAYKPQQQGNTVGIMAGSMPSNNFQLPNNQRSPFAGFNDPLWRDTQAKAEREGRRATIDEYSQAGGNANDYYKIYGGVDNAAFERIRAAKEGAKGRVSLQDYMGVGGNPNEYYKMYGDDPAAVNPQGPYAGIYNQQRLENYTQAGIDSQLNRINEQNPYGSSQYVTNPDGTVSRISSLSQPNQELLDQQYWQDSARNNAIGGILGQYAQDYKPMSQDYQGEANRAEQSAYGRYEKDLNSRFSQEENALRNRLVNSGYAPTSERYQRELADLEKRKSDSFMTARDQAIGAGQNQGNYLLSQELQRRNVPLSEMGALQAGVRGPQSPSFSQNYNVQMPYIDQAASNIDYAKQMQAWQREDRLRAEAEAKAGKGGRGGGGGRGRAPANPNAQYESQLLNFAMQSALNPQPRQANPLLQGLVGASPYIGQALFG